jgi:single-strand DNA-binding protein
MRRYGSEDISMNKIMLIGNAGKDADLQYSQTGTAVTKFSLAVNRRTTDRASGERKDETTWFNIIMFGKTAESLSNYVKKGSQVFVEGRLDARMYKGSDGTDRIALDVVVSDIQLLGSRADSARTSSESSPAQEIGPDEDFPF